MAGSQKRAYVITDNQRALNASWDRPNSCPLQNPKDDTEAISTEEQAFGRGSAPGRRLVVLSVADMRAPGGALPLLARFRQRQMREQAIGAAPCQCIVSGGILTVSPGLSTCGFSPLKQMRPTPDKQKSDCPTGWECHAVRAPGRERNDGTSKARWRLGRDHRILEHDAGEGLGGAPPGVAGPGANESGFDWHG